jgi:hypothetical protein
MDHFNGIDSDDDFIAPMLSRWAEDKYGVVATQVQFDFHEGYGGGCDTCGHGADEDSLTVVLTLPDGAKLRKDATYDSGLLNNILKFAAGEKT